MPMPRPTAGRVLPPDHPIRPPHRDCKSIHTKIAQEFLAEFEELTAAKTFGDEKIADVLDLWRKLAKNMKESKPPLH